MSTPSHSYPTFGALVDAFEVEVYRYLLRLTGHPAEADDLFQETFLRALRAFNRLRPRSNHRAWLYRIATNAFLNACRAARRRREVALPTELVGGRDHDQDHGARLDRAAAAARCIRAITSLPPRQRAAFVQRALEGRAYAEIAATLGCSQPAARANVYQAARRLRGVLGSTESRRERPTRRTR